MHFSSQSEPVPPPLNADFFAPELGGTAHVGRSSDLEHSDLIVFEAHAYLLVVVRGRPLHDVCNAIVIGGTSIAHASCQRRILPHVAEYFYLLSKMSLVVAFERWTCGYAVVVLFWVLPSNLTSFSSFVFC